MSPMQVARRAPSPQSTSSSSISASISSPSFSGTALHQSRSLPTNLPQENNISIEEQQSRIFRRTLSQEGRGLVEEQQGRVFRRAVSDRVRLAVEGMQGDEGEMLSPKRIGQRRRKIAAEEQKTASEKKSARGSPRRLRYEKISRLEDQENVRASRREIASPQIDAMKEKSNVDPVNPVRRSCSTPVAVKVEPVEIHSEIGPVQNSPRPLKQKAAELFASLPGSFSFTGRSSPVPESSSGRSPRYFGQRRPEREQTQKGDWSQSITDVILWRDYARSTLIFGVGAFCILSASYMQDMHFNIVTALSYIALIYLSAVFFRINFLQRLPSATENSWKLNETAALELMREVLPAINCVLVKLSQLFSGDPGTTLKVALALWCLAHAGYWMSLWNIFRIAYFGAFLIPKGYMAYSSQLHEQGNHFLSQLWLVWNNCTHKKVVACVGAILIWNVSTVSSRLWVAFLCLVAFRQYQTSRGSSVDASINLAAVKKEH